MMVKNLLLESIKNVREKHFFVVVFNCIDESKYFFKGINVFILPNQVQHEENLSANYKNKSEDL